ncbi:hypothetical protein G7047_07170 [Diaphorobacter sp. HDW4A]|uniref:hypothetical protein n=1 Tax=Diaphorobacter sp. HDW4A TaxID=2714924 RepID=UPI001409043B|nr:hypothetical protein [Diaphorobacter sp. HDW4A]QIL79708.1 hypothetical protein G7047_07170 [Diaphorobacter sp. HDW4A]
MHSTSRWTRCCIAMLGLGATAAFAQVVPGIVSVNEDGAARLHFTKPLPPDQPVFLQLPAGKGKFKCCVKVSRNDLKELREPVAEISGDGGDAPVGYELKHRLKGPFDVGYDAIAVSAKQASETGPYGLKASNGRTAMRAHLCYGTEGVNLIAKSEGKAQTLYRSFGYETQVKPQCNAADLKDLGG